MHSLPDALQTILDAIKHCAKQCNSVAFLYGNTLLYQLTGKESLLNKEIKLIISHDSDFSVNQFYQLLYKHIVIDQEIENSDVRYHIKSYGFDLKMELLYQFDPSDIVHARQFGSFNTDMLFYNLSSKKIQHPSEVTEDPSILINLNAPEEWNLEDLLGFAKKIGTIENVKIIDDQKNILKDLSLSTVRESLDINLEEEIEAILLSRHSGSALQFLSNTFVDGMPWSFKTLVDYLIYLDVPINDAANVETVFNEKKFNLVNLYNDYFLSEKRTVETDDEKHHRLTTSMKLLFDSPNLIIPKPYIETVTAMTHTADHDGPASDFCPYGNCESCKPSDCLGSKCCCCSSVDIVRGVRSDCYNRVFFSCNQSGTGPGVEAEEELPDFPVGCDACRDACDRALAGNAECLSLTQIVDGITPPSWFNPALQFGPCDCSCDQFIDPNVPSAGCGLTCVTCEGLSCKAEVNVTASACAYQLNVTPSSGCCGTPAFVDVVFAIDYSGSMGGAIAGVIASAGTFADDLAATGAQARFGILHYGRDGSCLITPANIVIFADGDILTTSVAEFKASLAAISITGGSEPDFEAAGVALQTYAWAGIENVLFLIGDEPVSGDCGPATGDISSLGNADQQPSVAALVELANSLGVKIYSIQPQPGDQLKRDLAIQTNGQDLDIAVDFSFLVDEINITAFNSSCDCLDHTPLPVELCKGGIDGSGNCLEPDINIPIGICTQPDNSDCNCNVARTFEVCGEIIVVEPDPETINLVCCGDIVGGGCNCPTTDFPEEGCCGVCGEDICDQYANLQQAIEGVWCTCWDKASRGIDGFLFETPNCDQCIVPDDADFDTSSLENCVIKVPDGEGGYTSIPRNTVVQEVTDAWARCAQPPEPPLSIDPASCVSNCNRADQFIIGDPADCTSVRNPDTVVLNNGIGIVAYESMENVSTIKIKQFNTSVPAKILPNRRTNYGRLQHTTRWEDSTGFSIVKLYYFEDLASSFLNGLSEPPAEGILTDLIIFQTGPFQNQCFSLQVSQFFPVWGSDDVGNFVTFIVPDGTALSNEFPSLDDVYNVEWFIIDGDDIGLTGSSIDSSTSIDETDVNTKLELSPHIHDGERVPVAYPSIATAYNYMNALENSHFVYLVYQALENQKWNLYMRQIRLSEYSQEAVLNVTESDNFKLLQDLKISELIYRIMCVTDNCETFGKEMIAKRTATLEVVLPDGREVFNESLLSSNESWPVCPGEPEGLFRKRKVIAECTHSTTVNKCPNQFEFNEIFYNWEVGDEFKVPFVEMGANNLFILLKKPNDNIAPLGEETIEISGITITSSQVAALWYEGLDVSSGWVTADNETLQDLLQFKGFDVSEPIPITEFEEGHCTNPVVAVNADNEVFVVYECTDAHVHQIHITGTVAPSTSFPLGVTIPKNIDANLDYFLSPSDFAYKNVITTAGEGTNQLPDIHIDPNDVVHVAWQSNRNNYWEIYYGNSENGFKPKRITDFKSKSLKPSIAGDAQGNIYIAWHDNRFDNWEIMMAYREDERVLTLMEQDPYLAAVRNTGYIHTTDTIQFSLNNTDSSVLCVSNLFVRFFTDRLLSNKAFDVLQSEFPMSFQLPLIDDINSSVLNYAELTDFTEKTITTTPDRTRFSPTSSVDTTLIGSFFDTINFVYTVKPIVIVFEAGETPDMDEELIALKQQAIENGENPNLLTNFNTSWRVTNRVVASGVQSGVDRNVEDIVTNATFNVPRLATDPIINTVPQGRYKRIHIEVSGLAESLVFTDIFSSITINSVVKDRICIAPGQPVTGFLDITPVIRVDKLGNETIETPVPVGINKNQAYFIQIFGIKDDGLAVNFGDPKRSISCETCVNDTSPWNSASCTHSFNLSNNSLTEETEFFNARIRFYIDEELTNLVAQFDAFKDGDLECFTMDDNQPAQDVWTNDGLGVVFEKTRGITLWPMLSNTSGLLCGVTYWITTEICSGTTSVPCDRVALVVDRIDRWTCNCGSPRWEEQFGEAPINIRDVVRWISSGDGFSDTRLTETKSGVNNYNPVIRLRADLTGIVIYESNRDDEDRLISENEKHSIYGTAFSIVPAPNMYATGAESINTKFREILVRSDIPISSCSADADCDDNSESILEGRNADFSFDQYDNIFLAAEKFADQTSCLELKINKQRTILVHRCGIQPANLAFSPEESGGSATIACNQSEIIEKIAPTTQDKVFMQIIKLVRVNNKFVEYHITRARKPAAVVVQCNIELEIVTEPGTIAVRVKNENGAWSNWYPFSAEIGENTIQIPWILSPLSGVKNVTIEAATYQGLSASFTLSVVADYAGIKHDIRFYKQSGQTEKLTIGTTDFEFPDSEGTPSVELLRILDADAVVAASSTPEESVFVQENFLRSLDGVPVAGIRQPIQNEAGDLENKTGEYIFIEIIPSQDYLESLGILSVSVGEQDKFSPTFDVLQQGSKDLFAIPTKFNGSNSFKGVFPVVKENETFFKDGLSFVVPHFQEDASDVAAALSPANDYIRDEFNQAIPGARISSGVIAESDVWSSERDELGKIKSPIDIRVTEDPYFVFGDPNYRLKKQNE